MMTSITRWVLAHKRIVAVILDSSSRSSGSRPSGQSTSSFSKKFSVPGREGFETNAAIARIYPPGRATTRRSSPVVTLPAGTAVVLAGGPGGPRARSQRSSSAALPGRGPPRTRRPATARSSRPTGAPRSCSPTRRPTTSRSATTRSAAKTAAAVLAGDHGRRRSRPRDRARRARRTRPAARSGPGVLLESMLGGARRAGRAGVRVRLAARVRPDPDGDRLDHDHVPGPVGRDRVHERLDDRRVPRRADRARRRDRLLAARRRPLARGARARPRRRGGGRARDGDRRPRGRLQRHDRRDRPAGDDRAAAAVPALDRLRRDADPAGQRDRRGDAAADRARQGRRPARLAAPPHGRQGQSLVDVVGAVRRTPAVGRGRRRRRSCSAALVLAATVARSRGRPTSTRSAKQGERPLGLLALERSRHRRRRAPADRDRSSPA